MASPVAHHISCDQLHVVLHHHGLKGLLRSSCEARCVEFSLDFMRVEAEREFAPGDRVIIDLSLDQVCMEELQGAIFDVAEGTEREYCYRVEFLYRNKQRTHSAEIMHCLRLIEDQIKHSMA